jgi:hypothetical protein
MKRAFILLFPALAICSPACQPKPQKTKEQVMEERLAERLERWRSEHEAACLQRVMDRATAIVDSTLIANARLGRDTSGAPFVPLRPEKPTYVPPKDSVPIRPLLPPGGRDTSRQGGDG